MPEDQWECSETYFYYYFSKNCATVDPIGKLELIFDWELAVKRPIKTLDYTLSTVAILKVSSWLVPSVSQSPFFMSKTKQKSVY